MPAARGILSSFGLLFSARQLKLTAMLLAYLYVFEAANVDFLLESEEEFVLAMFNCLKFCCQ